MQVFQHAYGRQFWLLCLSAFLFFASFNMIIPELPDYLSSLGGADYKGLIIALFTLAAGLSRPFSGKLSDTVGRLPVMVFGAVVCFVCGFFYPFANTVVLFLLLRFLHGFSTGFTPTGNAAYVADISPFARRGEALGLVSLAGSLGMAAGPAIGSVVANHTSLDVMFYASSGMALLSVLVVAGMKETLPNKVPFRLGLLKIKKNEVLEPRVLVPAFVLMLSVFAYGTVLTIIPDFSKHLGVSNKGLFFTCFTIASLGIRFVAGRASDKYGRLKVLKISTLALGISLIVIGLATNKVELMTGAVLFGVAVGMNSPTIMAWAVDLSHDEHRGRAMATVYIALEIGIGVGALLTGWLYDNNAARFPLVFMLSGAFCFIAFLVVLLAPKQKVIKN